jgi:hypothetical protein
MKERGKKLNEGRNIERKSGRNKKFWEEIIAYFP